MSRRVGHSGQVYVFEPQIKLFTELLINMHLNKAENVHFFRKAIGKAPGLIEMNPHSPTNEGSVGIGKGGDRAEMITVDSLNLNSVSLIKIDVEWSEEDVIRGARETILRNKPIMIVEIMGGVPYDKANPRERQEINRRAQVIQELGYNVVWLESHNFLCLPISARP
jgi:FkbM family methyltransferase